MSNIKLISHEQGVEKSFYFETAAIKEELGNIPLTYPDVIEYIDQSLLEGIQNTNMEDV